MDKKYTTTTCSHCGGHGLVSDYGLSGLDFEGAKECDTCYGKGFLFITPNKRLVVYPGGPFRGRLFTSLKTY